jgi:hypothetical protein
VRERKVGKLHCKNNAQLPTSTLQVPVSGRSKLWKRGRFSGQTIKNSLAVLKALICYLFEVFRFVTIFLDNSLRVWPLFRTEKMDERAISGRIGQNYLNFTNLRSILNRRFLRKIPIFFRKVFRGTKVKEAQSMLRRNFKLDTKNVSFSIFCLNVRKEI